MDSFLFALKAVLPIVLMVALGYFLKRKGFMTATFSKAANKLVFRVFLPAMMFLNVYRIEDPKNLDFGYVVYAVLAVVGIFLLSLPAVLAVTKKNERRGALWQACFRSNFALIGLPLAQSLFGDEGVLFATLLSSVVVPLFNVLAVISLSVFQRDGEKPSVRKILLGIVKNPLIQSVVLGFLALGIRALFVGWGVDFRLSQIEPVFTVLGQLSNLATPMALLVLGAQFEFSAVKALRKEILFGTAVRGVLSPLLGLGIAYLCFASRFGGAQFASLVALFATPVAVSSVPMAQEMGGDVELAGQLVVWTTLFSAFSVFLSAFFLRLGGIF